MLVFVQYNLDFVYIVNIVLVIDFSEVFCYLCIKHV